MFTSVLSDAANRTLARTRFADVQWVGETGSTNADLMRLARDGAPAGTVLVADHQTAGRGRADRTWTAPPGSSLLVSVLLRPAPAHASLSGMATGVAAADAIAHTCGVAVRLKWPNDLVWPGHGDTGDRKVGGILAEADWSDPERPAVVVGLGLNVNWPAFPEELQAIATSLNHITGHDVDRESLLVAILERLDTWCAHDGDDSDSDSADDVDVIDAVRARSATLGTHVRVQLANEAIDGDAVEITDDGHLVLVMNGGERRTITSGDVVHLRPTVAKF
jgi:BirA family biotin operon repressor/biotin-[acetyl-CoA-carboxylase] ligase